MYKRFIYEYMSTIYLLNIFVNVYFIYLLIYERFIVNSRLTRCETNREDRDNNYGIKFESRRK